MGFSGGLLRWVALVGCFGGWCFQEGAREVLSRGGLAVSSEGAAAGSRGRNVGPGFGGGGGVGGDRFRGRPLDRGRLVLVVLGQQGVGGREGFLRGRGCLVPAAVSPTIHPGPQKPTTTLCHPKPPAPPTPPTPPSSPQPPTTTFAATCVPSCSTTPAAAPPAVSMAATGAEVCTRAPAAMAAVARR